MYSQLKMFTGKLKVPLSTSPKFPGARIPQATMDREKTREMIKTLMEDE